MELHGILQNEAVKIFALQFGQLVNIFYGLLEIFDSVCNLFFVVSCIDGEIFFLYLFNFDFKLADIGEVTLLVFEQLPVSA